MSQNQDVGSIQDDIVFSSVVCRKRTFITPRQSGIIRQRRDGRVSSEAALAQALAAFETAFASFLADATTAEGGETGREAVAAAFTLLLLMLRGRLLVLHGGWGAVVLALGGTVRALRGTAVLALGRAVGGLRVLGIASSLVLVIILVGHG